MPTGCQGPGRARPPVRVVPCVKLGEAAPGGLWPRAPGTRGEAQAQPRGSDPNTDACSGSRAVRLVWVPCGPKGRDCPTHGRAGRGDRIRRGPRRTRAGSHTAEPSRGVSDGMGCGRRGWKRGSRPGQCGPRSQGSTLELGDNGGPACTHSTSVPCANSSPAAPLGAGHTRRGGSCSPEAPSRHRLQGRWRLRPGPGGGGGWGGVTWQSSHQ